MKEKEELIPLPETLQRDLRSLILDLCRTLDLSEHPTCSSLKNFLSKESRTFEEKMHGADDALHIVHFLLQANRNALNDKTHRDDLLSSFLLSSLEEPVEKDLLEKGIEDSLSLILQTLIEDHIENLFTLKEEKGKLQKAVACLKEKIQIDESTDIPRLQKILLLEHQKQSNQIPLIKLQFLELTTPLFQDLETLRIAKQEEKASLIKKIQEFNPKAALDTPLRSSFIKEKSKALAISQMETRVQQIKRFFSEEKRWIEIFRHLYLVP